MKRITLIFAILAAMTFNAGATIVTGKVTCEGAGVEGVSVSDGNKVVYTGKDGAYSIKTGLDLGYVFISVPSGYEVPSEGVIPQFFKRLDASQKASVADFTLKKVDQTKCNIVIFNDIHLTGDPVYHDLDQVQKGFFADVREHFKTLSDVPVYALTLGDMTTDSRWYKRNFALPEYLEQICRHLPFPVYHTMGNHDNDIKGGSDMAACKAYRDVIGPYYYSFNIAGYHFVVLDDIVYDMPLNEEGRVAKVTGYKTCVDARQLSWLKNDMKNVPSSAPVVILTHAPFYRIQGVDNGVYNLKEGFSTGFSPEDVLYHLRDHKDIYILSGHTHMNYYVEHENGVLEHNCVAVAGSSWYTESAFGHNMSSDGLPAGYSVYSIDNGNLSWYYKPACMAVEDAQFRAYDINVVPANFAEGLPDNTVLLNVFNYDPQWKIKVVENGKELQVRQIWARDPLYASGVEGHSFSKKGAFRANYNSHMFAVQAATSDADVEITVTDRFGRVFTQTLQRPGHFGLDMPLGNK